MARKGRIIDPRDVSRGLRQHVDTTKADVATFNSAKELGETRSKIAKQFVMGYFLIITGTFILTLIYNLILYKLFSQKAQDQIISPKDILLTVTGIVGSPLGFIVGYYFKDIEKKS